MINLVHKKIINVHDMIKTFGKMYHAQSDTSLIDEKNKLHKNFDENAESKIKNEMIAALIYYLFP
jgi:hypothetical protein